MGWPSRLARDDVFAYPTRVTLERRSFLQSLAFAAAAPKTTVASLETFVVKVNRRGNWIFVRLRTSDGVTGVGDASHGDDAATLRRLHQYFELLKGRSVHDIEAYRSRVFPLIEKEGRAAIVAASALEHCLWDIRGKILGLPVYDLLGGRVQPRIRNYANINRSTEPRTPQGFAQMAQRAVDAGFDAVKLAPFDEIPRNVTGGPQLEEFTRRGLACAQAVREVLGPNRDLLIDVHSHYDLEHGLDLARRFEPLKLFWLEEVTPAEPLANLARINREARMPTAGGESVFGVKGFYRYIREQAVDIVMPDIKYSGGMWETRKIAAIAEGAGLQVSPHGPASPIGNAAAAHVCAVLPNFLILEFSFGEVPYRAELIDPPEQLDQGCLQLSARPGFGIEINEKAARHYAA